MPSDNHGAAEKDQQHADSATAVAKVSPIVAHIIVFVIWPLLC